MSPGTKNPIQPHEVGATIDAKIGVARFEGVIEQRRYDQYARRWQYLIRWSNRPRVERTWTWHSSIVAVQSPEPPFMWRFVK